MRLKWMDDAKVARCLMFVYMEKITRNSGSHTVSRCKKSLSRGAGVGATSCTHALLPVAGRGGCVEAVLSQVMSFETSDLPTSSKLRRHGFLSQAVLRHLIAEQAIGAVTFRCL